MAMKRPNGEGTISLRKDGRWMGRVYVLTDAGFPERITVYGSSYEEVESEISTLKKKHQQGTASATSTSKVGEAMSYWLVEAA